MLRNIPKPTLARWLFVALNITISVLGFLRSYVLLKYLNFYELGLISIFQTIILLVGMLQIGVLNGSYRAYSGTDNTYSNVLNNFSFTFFLFLGGFTVIILAFYRLIGFSLESSILLLGTVAGVLSLIATYLNNTLLAKQKITEVNLINSISHFLGFASLILVLYKPIFALASFIIQPLMYIALTFIFNRSLVPNRLLFSFKILKYLLALGFVPYITALFTYLNLQIERWTIVFSMGVEEFGHFYLAIAFASLFALFPTSVNNLYFPRIVRANSEKNVTEFNLLLKRYSLILFFYCLSASILTVSAAAPLIEIAFPQHLSNLPYVYYILPGVLAMTLVSPCIIYFNALLIFKPLWISYFLGTIAIIVMLAWLSLSSSISLTSIAITDSMGNAVIGTLIILFFFVKRRKKHLTAVSTTSMSTSTNHQE